MMQWFVPFFLDGDVSGRSQLVEAATLARGRSEQLEETCFLACLLFHDAIVGDLDSVDSIAPIVHDRAVALEAPLFEMLAELFVEMADKHRNDLAGARAHFERSATLGAHFLRYGHRDGRMNFISAGAMALVAPLCRIGDEQFAAEIVGWLSQLSLYDTYATSEREHVVARAQHSIPADVFEECFAAGTAATTESITARLLDRLTTIEALIDTTGAETPSR